jgi:uncharacterized protein YceH (UPF0502 family)
MRLDKRISLAVLLAIAIETAGALIWAGSAAERIDQLEVQSAQSGQTNERLARLEAQVAAMRAQLDRIEARLDQR